MGLYKLNRQSIESADRDINHSSGKWKAYVGKIKLKNKQTDFDVKKIPLLFVKNLLADKKRNKNTILSFNLNNACNKFRVI